MKLTDIEKQQVAAGATPARNKGGRPINPEGTLAIARHHGINNSTLRGRLRRGMTLEEALAAPVLDRRQCGKRAAKAR